MQLSDDGQWMWNGTDWVPVGEPAVVQSVVDPTPIGFTGTTVNAPTQVSISMPQMNQPQVVYVQEEKSSSRIIPWIGVGVILLSLFMPYISFSFDDDFSFDVSGFEMIGILGELAEMASEDTGSSDSDGYDEPGGDDQGLGSDEMTILVATFMFGLSPLVFIVSGITSGILLLMKKSTKIMGILHLSYTVIFLFFAMLTPSLGDLSIFSLIGFGFYLGTFSGGAFLAK